MAALTQTRRAVGRIGFEFDANGLFCAQVRKHGTGWKLIHSRAAAAIQNAVPDTDHSRSALFKANDLLQAAAGFRGSEVASVLPMEACDLRVLELPAASQSELRLMIANEFEASPTSDTVFDFWTLPVGMTPRKDLTGICSLSTDRRMISETVRLIQAGGFTISGIDGLPTACGRAVSMMDASGAGIAVDGDESLRMAVHIGWKRCTIVLARDGVPLLARVPQVQGLSSFLEATCTALGLSPQEMLRLMRGLRDDLLIQPSAAVMGRLHNAARAWCLPLCEEVLRSVAFSGRPGLRMVPSAIILMGSGSIINGLAEIMTEELNMAAQLWQIPAGECVSNGPEFAVAAALSAWEIDT